MSQKKFELNMIMKHNNNEKQTFRTTEPTKKEMQTKTRKKKWIKIIVSCNFAISCLILIKLGFILLDKQASIKINIVADTTPKETTNQQQKNEKMQLYDKTTTTTTTTTTPEKEIETLINEYNNYPSIAPYKYSEKKKNGNNNKLQMSLDLKEENNKEIYDNNLKQKENNKSLKTKNGEENENISKQNTTPKYKQMEDDDFIDRDENKIESKPFNIKLTFNTNQTNTTSLNVNNTFAIITKQHLDDRFRDVLGESYNNVTLSIADDTRRVDNTQKVLLTAIVSFVSSSDATQQDIDVSLKASFSGSGIFQYLNLIGQSTDSILSSAIDVVFISEASMYPSGVALRTLSPTIRPSILESYLPSMFSFSPSVFSTSYSPSIESSNVFIPSANPSLIVSSSPSSAPSILPISYLSSFPTSSPSLLPSYMPNFDLSSFPSATPSELGFLSTSPSPSALMTSIFTESPSFSPTFLRIDSFGKIDSSLFSLEVQLTLRGESIKYFDEFLSLTSSFLINSFPSAWKSKWKLKNVVLLMINDDWQTPKKVRLSFNKSQHFLLKAQVTFLSKITPNQKELDELIENAFNSEVQEYITSLKSSLDPILASTKKVKFSVITTEPPTITPSLLPVKISTFHPTKINEWSPVIRTRRSRTYDYYYWTPPKFSRSFSYDDFFYEDERKTKDY